MSIKRNFGISSSSSIWVLDCMSGFYYTVSVERLYKNFATKRFMALSYDKSSNSVKPSTIIGIQKNEHVATVLKRTWERRFVELGRDADIGVYNTHNGTTSRRIATTVPTGHFFSPRNFDIVQYQANDTFGYVTGCKAVADVTMSLDLCFRFGVFSAVVQFSRGHTLMLRVHDSLPAAFIKKEVYELFKMMGEDIIYTPHHYGNKKFVSFKCNKELFRVLQEQCSDTMGSLTLPQFILTGSDEMQHAWLEGFFATKFDKKYTWIHLSKKSQLYVGLRLLLTKFGIPMKECLIKSGNIKAFIFPELAGDTVLASYIKRDEPGIKACDRQHKDPNGIMLSGVCTLTMPKTDITTYNIDVADYKNYLTDGLFVIYEDVVKINKANNMACSSHYNDLYIMP